jgi:hypothetical protein
MNRNPLPYPPQMRNGGLPLAHLPLSSLSDPSAWLHYKWSQPPPCAPDWVFDYYEHYNPPAGVGRPLCNEEWHQRAVHKDQQTAGLLPPSSPGGPILHGARTRLERAYHDWKRAIDNLWADERHRLFLLDEEAARARNQEAARRQQLLDEEATRAWCQEAAGCQQLLNKQAARARQEAAAAHARVSDAIARARQEAARRQQLLKEQASCARQEAARRQKLLDEHAACARMSDAIACTRQEVARRQKLLDKQAAVLAKAAIDEATKQLRQEGDALRAIALEEAANKRRRHEAATHAKALAAQELEEAADERRCHEAAAHAKALAAKVLADKRGGQELAMRAKVFAAQALAIAPSLHPRPTSYVGAVLSTLGGSLLLAVPSSPPSPTTSSPLQTVC